MAIVTGAASGLGRALAVELSLRGAIVVCGDKNHDGLKEALIEIVNSNIPAVSNSMRDSQYIEFFSILRNLRKAKKIKINLEIC